VVRKHNWYNGFLKHNLYWYRNNIYKNLVVFNPHHKKNTSIRSFCQNSNTKLLYTV
jgi:hypothetical protein